MYAYVILSQSLQENLKLLIIHQICQIIHQLHFFFFLGGIPLGEEWFRRPSIHLTGAQEKEGREMEKQKLSKKLWI